MPEEKLKQRLKILYLYIILWEHTDDDHPLSMPQIKELLSKEYGITAERKALYQDIKALQEFDKGVAPVRNGNQSGYCMQSRAFEIPELVALADAVTCSNFFSKKKAKNLLEKLGTLCSEYERKNISRGAFVSDGNPYENERIYYNIDAIQNAIESKKQISFSYFDYVLNKSHKPVPKTRDGQRICSPYALTWNDGKYYLIAHYEKYGGISHFRVDRMENVKTLNKPAVKMSKELKLSEYMRSTFSMFSGKEKKVRLRFEDTLLNPVIDRFGKDVSVVPDEADGYFIIEVPIKAEHPEAFFGWLFQFGTKAQILEPASLRKKYADMLKEVLKSET